MNWELKRTDNVEWAQDDSGVYTLIACTPDNELRVDVMGTTDNMPVVSFIGTEHNVRITLMRWLSDNVENVSLEHAAYIGRELTRADNCIAEQTEYVQD